MKFNFLPLFVIGLSITSVLGSTGCVGTTYTYRSDGLIREKNHDTGEVRLNRGQFCVVVKQNGQPLADRSVDLELSYSVEGRTKRTNRALGLDDSGTKCFTVQFPRPVSSEDIRLRRARIKVFPETGWRYGKLKLVEINEDRTEGRIWMEFNMEDTRESLLDPVGELSYGLNGATGSLSFRPSATPGAASTSGRDRNEHEEAVALGTLGGSAAAHGAL